VDLCLRDPGSFISRLKKKLFRSTGISLTLLTTSVEKAKSGRSKCGQKGKAVHHTDELIEKV
jgi:hypothetical protein